MEKESRLKKIKNLEFGKGDIFTEFYSIFFFIIGEKGNDILVLERREGEFKSLFETNKEDFEKKIRYENIEGYWCDYIGNSIQECKTVMKKYTQGFEKKEKRNWVNLILKYEEEKETTEVNRENNSESN